MKRYMAKRVLSFGECEAFVRRFCSENPFSDPMLSDDKQITDRLIKAIAKREDHIVIGVFKDREMAGLFLFLVLKDEQYLEMLAGLSCDREAYNAMFAYLKEHFAGYSADVVFNPNNELLSNWLRQKGAAFDTEQQKMVYGNSALDADTSGVALLTEPYILSYLEMHNANLYWTGDKVIEAPDRFRTFVAVENGTVVGYLDVTHCFEENEPFDLLVREGYRRKGYGRKLLAKALEMNRPNAMVLHVNIDNVPAIRLYESLGFVKAENQNSVVARLFLS